jgi:tetratricopeptide (TPR) repeat protein
MSHAAQVAYAFDTIAQWTSAWKMHRAITNNRVLVFASLVMCAPAFGASQNDYDDCMQHNDPDRAIAGCTRIIDDLGESNRNRRIAYDNRGTVWHAKGDNDRAIADYTAAITLNPRDTVAYDNRGTAWRDKGDHARALADYNVAIKLNPDNAAAYNNRGNIWHEQGDNARAVADYSEAIRLEPKYALAYCNRGNAWHARGDNIRAIADCSEAIRLDPNSAVSYRIRGVINFDAGDFAAAAQDLLRASELAVDPYAALWLFIARARAGEDGAVELAVNAARLKTKDWPSPVIDLYVGRLSLEAMRAAATNPAQRCAAEFYTGEWHLLQGNARAARSALTAATAPTFSKSSKEYSGALAELKRLKP